jgi:acyl carrier protein
MYGVVIAGYSHISPDFPTSRREIRYDVGKYDGEDDSMATTTTPATPQAGWTEAQITDLVVELLADMLHEDAGDLRVELLERGGGMPVDSLDLFDVLAEFRQRTGLTIPKRKLRRDTMRSVSGFASFAAREATN